MTCCQGKPLIFGGVVFVNIDIALTCAIGSAGNRPTQTALPNTTI